jgi:type II secretory ATPase GspE/PulE/Tfp pilus assembly ATPase PilB-like protein
MEQSDKKTQAPHSKTAPDKNSSVVKTSLRIGEILVKEGLVTKEAVQKALAIQRQEEAIRKLPLGQILVKNGALSESSLENLLNHPDLKRNIGTLAIDKGLITKDQLEFCLKNKKPAQLIGDVLIKEGLFDPEDVGKLLEEQINAPKLGELGVKLKLISQKDLEVALRIQKSSRILGEILCDLNFVNPVDLNYVLNKYNKQLELGEILLTLGNINKQQLNAARQEQSYSSDSMGQILVKKKFITPEQLQFALSKQYNIPFKDLTHFVYGDSAKKTLSSIVSQKYAEKNLVLPISLEGSRLTLALFKPNLLNVVYELKNMYGHLRVLCILITQKKFEELFEILYSKRLGRSRSADQQAGAEDDEDIDFMELSLDEEMGENDSETTVYGVKDIEAEELVNFIVKYGIINNASDIHIEQDRKGIKLRYRMDGVLREANVGWLKEKIQEKVGAVISRIKVMSNLDIAEKRLPQDGVFRINYYDKGEDKKFDLDFRVATCRGITGENVTVRILDSRKANVGLANLNHSPHVLDPFKTLLKSSAGMILVSGPTGSGKSSTLYGALQYVYDPGIKIITAEDPIEYSFPGIMQTQINPKIGLTFSRLLRSFLRLDPDVILVGEIRDEETAKIGFDAAQTGHLLLSTIHTNDAISAVPRLIDLNVEYGQISSCLMCVLAQRLVRRICPSCIKEYVPGEDEWGMIFKRYPAHLTFYKGQGCDACNFTGYKGRTLLSEVFVVNNEISQALNRGLDVDGITKLAIESGMKTMLEDGLLKINDTTLSEIIRVIPHDMIKEFRSREQAQDVADFLIESLLEGGGGPPKKDDDVSPKSFQMSNPETERVKLDLIQQKYESLKANSGQTDSTVDSSLFKEFIAENFYTICSQYKCKTVTFNIENNAGTVEISAVPDS